MVNKTISASKLRDNLSEALDTVDKDTVLIVTRRGKAERAIIDLDELEDLLDASDPEFVKTIAEARAQVKRGEVSTFDEVFGDI